MPLVIPDCYIVSVKGISGGQDVVNVLGFYAPGNTALSMATAVQSSWKVASGPMSQLPNSYVLTEIKAMDIGSLSGSIAVIGDNTPGTKPGTLATNAACALITYGNGTRAKSSRGRMYFGPITETDVNSDGRTIATIGNFTTGMQNFRSSVNSNGRVWSVLSRKNATHSPITTIATQNVIATQRRRIR